MRILKSLVPVFALALVACGSEVPESKAFEEADAAVVPGEEADAGILDPGTDPDAGVTDPDAGYVCSAADCASGCCQNNVCVVGNTEAACGTGGEACAACPSHQTCSPISRDCVLDPDQLWGFKVIHLEVQDKKPNGDDWDMFTGPDPFVQFTWGVSLFNNVTAGPEDDHTVIDWKPPHGPIGVELPATLLMDPGVGVEVFDYDDMGHDAIASKRTIKLTEADFSRGTLSLTNWGSVKRIDFVIAQPK